MGVGWGHESAPYNNLFLSALPTAGFISRSIFLSVLFDFFLQTLHMGHFPLPQLILKQKKILGLGVHFSIPKTKEGKEKSEGDAGRSCSQISILSGREMKAFLTWTREQEERNSAHSHSQVLTFLP